MANRSAAGISENLRQIILNNELTTCETESNLKTTADDLNSNTAETQDQNQNEAINQEAIPQELENIKAITITRALGPRIAEPNLVKIQTTYTTVVLEPKILQIDSGKPQKKRS